ncbi:MAG: hypothetical protein LCH84_19340 [Gemmatimonadetes bacterium]|nr:hypothetical protein [Gemmatimonadota bacterium]
MRRIREVRLIAACITLALLVLAPGGTARAQEDSARVHGTLRKAMHQFFMAWRKEWIASELERNDPQERFGRAAPESPRARRVGMQVCPKVWSSAVLPPMMVRYRFQEGEHSVLRWIQTKRGDTPGAVCVDWIFDPTTGYPDESERLDHALSLERRRPMYAAREQLLRTISQAATRYPADRWILGQQIRFLLDQVQLDAALAAAQSCEGDDTLCLSLRGLVHAARGDIVAAEAHFTAYDSVVSRAGRTAADSVGCRVDELAMLRPRTDRELEKTPCARLDSLVQTLWWLADPLWSEPGNTRFVEHHVRRVQVALRAVTDEDERYPWGRLCDREARRSQVLRYGWPSYHYLITDRYPPRGAPPQVCPFTPPLTLEYSEQQVSLIPQWRALEDPFGATPDDW